VTLESDAKIDQRMTEDPDDGLDLTTEADAENSQHAEDDAEAAGDVLPARRRRVAWSRVIACGILPGLALMLALGAGYLKWQDASARDAQLARIQSVRSATDGTVALLSYRPDTVEQDLSAASDRLTGDFRNAYTSLTRDVVIPGSKEKHISAVANVAAAASASATENHAVVLIFVNQTIIVGSDAPSVTASAVRVTLDKTDGRWLISSFDPV
jgi:Mce-associated membrane protein